jgi:hypothetical protein
MPKKMRRMSGPMLRGPYQPCLWVYISVKSHSAEILGEKKERRKFQNLVTR